MAVMTLLSEVDARRSLAQGLREIVSPQVQEMIAQIIIEWVLHGSGDLTQVRSLSQGSYEAIIEDTVIPRRVTLHASCGGLIVITSQGSEFVEVIYDD